MPDRLVVDASAMVDLLLGAPKAAALQTRLRGHDVHVPAHFYAEVLSALGRLERGGHLSTTAATDRIGRLAAAPFERHHLGPLLGGAWGRRANVRLVDALYVELATLIDARVVTVDAGLAAAAPEVEYVD